MLLTQRACSVTLSVPRKDWTAGVPAPQAAAVCAAFACEVTCPTTARAQLVPLFSNPVRFIRAELPVSVLSLSWRCAAAYSVHLKAKVARVTSDSSRLESLRLPLASQRAQGTTHGAVDFGCDDEGALR